jgi:M6 family metalloprotease-like protein
MKTKKTLIFIILIFAPLVFSQTLPPDFFRQYSKRSTSENGVNFAPYDYKHIGSGKFEGGGANRDSVIIYALRVEFRPDSVINTTGNGLFMRGNAETHQISTDSVLRIYDPKSPAGMRLSRTDRKEFEWYRNTQNTYKYDKLPHDSTYIDEHLTALRNYYLEASNGKIRIGREIFPSGAFGAFRLNNEMASYSPGNKRNNESNDDFGIRRSRALMRFVLEAVDSANNSQNNSPFKNLKMDENGRLFDENDIPVFILLFHAGSSGLTDGGTGGSGNADSPSDFQDIFVNEEWFKFFNSSSSQENNFAANIEKDSVSKKIGAKVTGKEGKAIYLSELMMVSETANQDSLNWGINGILVNQFARQIGVPDLYSTSSGTTGIGSFGIMDFAGYSAAQGFIPPNPSAFIRSYMGWSEPILANPEPDKKFALSVSKDNSKNNLYLVPINNSEYYLIENRQRNLTGSENVFVYDTINGKPYISSGFQLNLENCVNSVSSRSVVWGVKSESRDVGIPASGVCVWHIDEKLIENRIKYNMLNSDSSYRAVSLKEADGVVDIGVEFTDMLGYPWYDYGNAGDVFPHRNTFLSTNKSTVANIMSPTTMPSTAANDGGNSYLKLSFENSDTSKKEIYYYSKSSKGDYESYSITNYSDSVINMRVSLENNNISPKFSTRVKGSNFYPLLTANVFEDGNGGEKEIIALSKDGFLSVISEKGTLIYEEKIADEIKNMPSFIDNNLYISCKDKILIYNGEYAEIKKDSIMDFDVSSYIVGLDDNLWVFGTNDGKLIFGSGKKTIENSVSLDNENISAIAKFKEKTAVAVSEKGNVFIVSNDGKKSEKYELLNAKYAFFPFKIAVSNDRIIVCDNKQGLWFLTYFEENGKIIIKRNENQQEFPVDWAGIFREQSSREDIPENHGFLSMANLDESGDLRLLVGGTNGVYAFDEKGYLLENYPAILDRADWYIRKSVLATPTSAKNKNGEHFIFFATTTGDEKSYYQTKITRPPDTVRGIIYFDDINGKPDSMSGFSKKYIIDTLLSYNDSMFLPYFAPGGLIDIRIGKTGKRPDLQIPTQNTGKNRIFPYLISVGESLSQGVVLDNLSDDELDLIAVSDNGMLYRFGLPEFLANQTDMTGGNAARQFNFEKTQNSKKQADNILEYFYSYPNPVKISKGDKGAVTFRYELGNNASSAHLTVYTVQGQKVFEEKNLRVSQGVNEFVLNDLSRFG